MCHIRGSLRQHRPVAHSAGEYVKHGAHTNGIESVWAVLRRSLLGVYHHVTTKHLHRYLNEATFRLHEGNCQIDTIDRLRTLGQGLSGKRLTYQETDSWRGCGVRALSRDKHSQ